MSRLNYNVKRVRYILLGCPASQFFPGIPSQFVTEFRKILRNSVPMEIPFCRIPFPRNSVIQNSEEHGIPRNFIPSEKIHEIPFPRKSVPQNTEFRDTEFRGTRNSTEFYSVGKIPQYSTEFFRRNFYGIP